MIGPSPRRLELGDPGDVGDRARRTPVGPVGGRKRLPEAPIQLGPALLAVRGDQRRTQVIAPGARLLGDPRLDPRHVEVGRDPVRGSGRCS